MNLWRLKRIERKKRNAGDMYDMHDMNQPLATSIPASPSQAFMSLTCIEKTLCSNRPCCEKAAKCIWARASSRTIDEEATD
jgi:hypothetical protein